jgi:hypothetical protein
MKGLLLVPFVFAAACHDTTVDIGDLEQVLALPAIPNHDVDVLFVVDNSPSMLDKQQAMMASFPRMMDALAALDGGMPSLHIGVVTSDMGSMGSLDMQPGPPVPGSSGGCNFVGDDGVLQHAAPELNGAMFIEDFANPDGTRTRNYTGELRDVFAEIAAVGANGCGFEQHMAAMRRGLGNPANAGFLRPNADLAVVVVADEDDCSMTHAAVLDGRNASLGPLQSFRCTRYGVTCDVGGVTTDDMNATGTKSECHARVDSDYIEDVKPFVDFLVGLKGDPQAVMVAVLAGTTDTFAVELRAPDGGGTGIPSLAHSCDWQDIDGYDAVADPAIRLKQLADAFPGRSRFASVCNADLSLSLSEVGYTTANLLGDPCVATALEDISDAPGVQPRCEVTDGDEPTPPCDAMHTDHCWRMVEDAAHCAGRPDQLRFEIVRPAPPMVQQYANVRCAVAKP